MSRWQDAFEKKATQDQETERATQAALDAAFEEAFGRRKPLASVFAKNAEAFGGRGAAAAAFKAALRDWQSDRQHFAGWDAELSNAVEIPPLENGNPLAIGRPVVFRQQTPKHGRIVRLAFIDGPLDDFRHWDAVSWETRKDHIISEYQIAAIQEGNLSPEDPGLHPLTSRYLAEQGS